MVSEPEKELNSEFSRDNFGSIDTTRLMNSDVMQDLDATVPHLSGSQHLDLEMLVEEFKNLFSDVPYRRGQSYYGVDIGDAVQVNSTPLPTFIGECLH